MGWITRLLDGAGPVSNAGPADVTPKGGRCAASGSLADLSIGQGGIVVGITGESGNDVGRRLSDLGFLAGTHVLAVRRAPLGEPTIYELRGYQMSLRRAEAQRILVEAARPA